MKKHRISHILGITSWKFGHQVASGTRKDQWPSSFNQRSVANSCTLQLHDKGYWSRQKTHCHSFSHLLWAAPLARHPFGTLSIIIPYSIALTSFKKKELQFAFVKAKGQRLSSLFVCVSQVPTTASGCITHQTKQIIKPRALFSPILFCFSAALDTGDFPWMASCLTQ